jgi:hypothetical protein
VDYIFDIIINFNQENILDYYEWYYNDNIKYIKRIPLVKINNTNFMTIKNNIINFNIDFLSEIYNECEIIRQKKIIAISYACLFTNGKEVFAVELDKKGKVIMWGGLLFDEQYGVIEKVTKIRTTNIKYQIIEPINKRPFLTRKEQEIIIYLTKKIREMYLTNDEERLKYLYYECFNKLNHNIDNIYQQLLHLLNLDLTNKHQHLYHIVQLLNQKEVMSKNP